MVEKQRAALRKRRAARTTEFGKELFVPIPAVLLEKQESEASESEAMEDSEPKKEEIPESTKSGQIGSTPPDPPEHADDAPSGAADEWVEDRIDDDPAEPPIGSSGRSQAALKATTSSAALQRIASCVLSLSTYLRSELQLAPDSSLSLSTLA